MLRPTDPLKTTDPVTDALRGSTRRSFLIDGAGVLAAGSLAGGLLTSRRTWARAADLTEPAVSQVGALRVLGRSSMRLPDSLPNPAISAATDTLPQIEHVVVLMMENHSYDNFLGMLGRGAGQAASRGRVHARVRRTSERDQPVRERSTPARVPHADDLPGERPPLTGMAGLAHPVRQRYQPRVRDLAQRSGLDGLLDGPGSPVHVRPRDPVPDRGSLVLQRARPDRPEPPLPDRGHLGGNDRRHRRVARQLRPRRIAAGAGQRHDLRSADRGRDQLD